MPLRGTTKESKDKKRRLPKGNRLLCRESLLMASPTEYARTGQPKGFSVSEGHGQSTSSGGFLPSIEPWNKSRRYRTVTP